MEGSPASRQVSWKGKLRRLLAAPFRFLLKDELQRLENAERAVANVTERFAENAAALSTVAQAQTTYQRELNELRQAYLATRSEFEEVRDTRLPRVEADFGNFQKAFLALQGELEQLRDVRILVLERAAQGLQGAFDELQRELVRLRDEALPRVETTQGLLQKAHEQLQQELELLRDNRLPELSAALQAVQTLAEEVRDHRLPAASARLEALVERLFEEITVTRSLVDRLLAHEPLQVGVLEQPWEEELPEAVRRAWLRFLESHRGSRQEILTRASEYVEVFRGADPVLDLGCGRGELLEALTKAGIPAFGVDSDPTAVAECQRRGLEARVLDALEALAAQPQGSLGGVACVHLIEHLPAARWMKLFEQAARVLRPGGILAVESPNPETLRVGAGLFWVDPTHLRPVHPEAARFVAEAVGLELVEVRKLRPFPPEQQLAAQVNDERWRPIFQQLDAWLSGARDYLLVARKPFSEKAGS
ncbi:Trans-aconitate 2-methyltransferase [bacterium HR09]|nr:Trans-aconitate 2-methyltransferase [bacterium HR09]